MLILLDLRMVDLFLITSTIRHIFSFSVSRSWQKPCSDSDCTECSEFIDGLADVAEFKVLTVWTEVSEQTVCTDMLL